MTKQDLDTLNLAEHLCLRDFAAHPEEDLNKLVTRCVEAAVVFDETIAKLNSTKPTAKAKAA